MMSIQLQCVYGYCCSLVSFTGHLMKGNCSGLQRSVSEVTLDLSTCVSCCLPFNPETWQIKNIIVHYYEIRWYNKFFRDFGNQWTLSEKHKQQHKPIGISWMERSSLWKGMWPWANSDVRVILVIIEGWKHFAEMWWRSLLEAELWLQMRRFLLQKESKNTTHSAMLCSCHRFFQTSRGVMMWDKK